MATITVTATAIELSAPGAFKSYRLDDDFEDGYTLRQAFADGVPVWAVTDPRRGYCYGMVYVGDCGDERDRRVEA